MSASPFEIFRRHQIMTVVLIGLAMLSFVIFGAVQDPTAIPAGLWILALAFIVGGAAWVAGLPHQKQGRWGLMGLAGGAALGLLFTQFAQPVSAVQMAGGDISDRELYDLNRDRNRANEFLGRLRQVSVPDDRQGLRPDLSFGLRAPNTEMGQRQAAADWELLHREADRLGIRVSDETVSEYLQTVTDGRATQKAVAKAANDVNASQVEIYQSLKEHIAAKIALRYLVSTAELPPEQYFDFYRKMNEERRIDAVRVPVAAFAGDEEPDEAELQAFFAEYRGNFPNTTPDGRFEGGRPGFYQPPQVSLAYAEFPLDALKEKVEQPTEEELRKAYEEELKANANPFETPDFPALPGEPSVEGPALDGPALDGPALSGPKMDAPKAEATQKAEATEEDEFDAPALPKKSDAPKADEPKSDEANASEADDAVEEVPVGDEPAGDEDAKTGRLTVPSQTRLVAFFQEDEPQSDEPPSDEPAEETPEAEKKPDAEPKADAAPATERPKKAPAAKPKNNTADVVTEKPAGKADADKPAADEPDADKPAADRPSAPKMDAPPAAAPKDDAPADDAGKSDESDDADKPAGDKAMSGSAPPADPFGDADKPEPADAEPPTFEERKDDLRRQIVERRALELQNKLVADMQLKLVDLKSRASYGEDDETGLSPEQIAKEIKAWVAENGGSYAETPMMRPDRLEESEDHPVGGATVVVGRQTLTVANAAARLPAGERLNGREARDFETGNAFVWWKTGEREAYVPESLDDEAVRAEVVEAYRLQQARPKAEERAEEIAATVREAGETDLDEALEGVEIAEGEPAEVVTTRPFAWLESGTAAAPNAFFGERRPFDFNAALESEDLFDDDFAEAIFDEIKPGEAKVLPTADRQAYYVVRVREGATDVAAEDFRDRFLKQGGSMFFPVQYGGTYQTQAERLRQGTTKNPLSTLEQDYGVVVQPVEFE